MVFRGHFKILHQHSFSVNLITLVHICLLLLHDLPKIPISTFYFTLHSHPQHIPIPFIFFFFQTDLMLIIHINNMSEWWVEVFYLTPKVFLLGKLCYLVAKKERERNVVYDRNNKRNRTQPNKNPVCKKMIKL